MFHHTPIDSPLAALRRRPRAYARVLGSHDHPDLTGSVAFYEMAQGVLVTAEFFGLPTGQDACHPRIFAFHIHSGSVCSGNSEDPFANAGTHYNPKNCRHPYHASDLPPVFGNGDYAFSAFVTDRFSIHEVVGKTVILHAAPDDFTTQPSGNAGAKIACGQIHAVGSR